MMKSIKYNLWQSDNGWRGCLEGYPEYEIEGESFQELQGKLWQMHQDLTSNEPDSFQPKEPATVSRCPMSQAQVKRRERVEQLIFALISNP